MAEREGFEPSVSFAICNLLETCSRSSDKARNSRPPLHDIARRPILFARSLAWNGDKLLHKRRSQGQRCTPEANADGIWRKVISEPLTL